MLGFYVINNDINMNNCNGYYLPKVKMADFNGESYGKTFFGQSAENMGTAFEYQREKPSGREIIILV